MNDMAGSIIIVTGANSGMGLATTIELAKLGAHVVMACRSQSRGEAALHQALEESGSTELELMTLDLGSFDSIRAFAADFKVKHNKLDVLVNNAGVVTIKRELTKDGYEAMIGVNHLGHFLLTNELLEPLQRARQGRIVNVSSGAHKVGSIHWEDPNLAKGFNVAKGYAQSKLANILFTKELARRLQPTRVTVNALHPGAVSTSLGVNRDTGFGKAVYKLLRPFFLTALEGARTAIYLASSPEVEHVTGEYYVKCKPDKTTEKARDPKLAARLWEWSEQQVGMKQGMDR
ncbi:MULTISPECIES: SDR family oxidoreductase [Paenibacillus]|jgi:NAD(P)-dependent dehydrogenase (short-subunit alcohol dehydrogenase family)|uniref:SDR family oxidoreductase n=1 Tax=Paenibacillus TaxID=44249 RepID=UPI0003E1C3C4|nr:MULTISPECIES: SDR family oxidoreductase [Paenibacillus]ETT31232.1 short-chain dehydrogenase/reductase SDR [Paenibacillus sp. FSL R5-808]